MLIKLASVTVYDPVNGVNAEVRDIYIRDGRIIGRPGADETIDEHYDLKGCAVMAGAIDIHTHIGGGKLNLARMLLPEDHRDDPVPATRLTHSGCGHAVPAAPTAGYRYAELGYTACFEPAMLPSNARQTHLELADTPMVDKGAYALLGSDDYLLRMLKSGKEQEAINDYVAWTLQATQSLAIKVVNPGGINAFKFNQRQMDIDEPNSHYGVTPRQILTALSRAVHELGVTHPLHVHGCNLGVPGNVDTTLSTINGSDGLPLHLTHIQFHSYGTEGDRGFSSGAAQIAEAVNRNKNVSIDVGQIMFGQTVTASGDTMKQHAAHKHASPNKWIAMDIECDAGCGVVPFRYKDKNFVNALQWAIGLELFLMVDDPWRIFLTTDHPNGAPFTTYPHLIRLLMDKSFRDEQLKRIHPDAAAASTVGSLSREYSLYEIAIMTRAAPAKSLGLQDYGHLAPGAVADITVYRPHKNAEAMFEKPEYVFKDGRLIVKRGKVVRVVAGGTHTVRPEYDGGIEKDLKRYFDRYHTMQLDNFRVADSEITDTGINRLIVQPTRARTRS